MDSFRIFDVSASGFMAQKIRMNSIASNLANISTTKTENGEPYRRKDVEFSSVVMDETGKEPLEGVKVSKVVEDQSPFKVIYDPGHPDADKNGFVKMPNMNVIEEMVNMMMASRVYEANVNAFNISKNMFMKALEIGR
jgi:flagellar basal-body rod protein FlgC